MNCSEAYFIPTKADSANMVNKSKGQFDIWLETLSTYLRDILLFVSFDNFQNAIPV